MRKVRLPPGPVVADVVGPALTDEDRERLRHPAAGAVILFSRNYENPEQLKLLAKHRISGCHLTLTDERGLAVATVILECAK